jgi:RNA:NAD 2'-phosphotransferase (TPT1/KptA family)
MGHKLHGTLRRNLKSIRRQGLKAKYCTGKRRAVWVVPGTDEQRAADHVIARHHVLPLDVVIVEVDDSKLSLKRHGDGSYYVVGDVPASAITRVWGYSREEM